MSKETADRVSKSLDVLKEMMDTTDREMKVPKSSGAHHATNLTEDITCLMEIFKEARLFQTVNGTEFKAFPKFKRDLFYRLRHS